MKRKILPELLVLLITILLIVAVVLFFNRRVKNMKESFPNAVEKTSSVGCNDTLFVVI